MPPCRRRSRSLPDSGVVGAFSGDGLGFREVSPLGWTSGAGATLCGDTEYPVHSGVTFSGRPGWAPPDSLPLAAWQVACGTLLFSVSLLLIRCVACLVPVPWPIHLGSSHGGCFSESMYSGLFSSTCIAVVTQSMFRALWLKYHAARWKTRAAISWVRAVSATARWRACRGPLPRLHWIIRLALFPGSISRFITTDNPKRQ